MKRAIVIVLDGCGAGAAPDAADFGDLGSSTLLHVWETVGGFQAPNLQQTGFLVAGGIGGVPEHARAGRLRPLSKAGKDSVTGHWEMMGIVLPEPFPTFPNGFPPELIRQFEARIGVGTLGNRAASGTKIIAELGAEHLRTAKPIVYTSADSVFQIAAHESVVPVDRLYEMCRIARELCVGPHAVTRVIARPFVGSEGEGFVRTEKRKDFPLDPPPNLVDQVSDVLGIGVVPELFNFRGFRSVPRTQSNAQHEAALWSALESDARFIFANFEDTDMLFGHRNDPAGFARCLEDFDRVLGMLINRLTADDLLILTADHGNDPTTPSTDHSREYVPFCCVHGPSTAPERGEFGDLDGFAHVGMMVANHLGIDRQ
jgi:phosphopentomutase